MVLNESRDLAEHAGRCVLKSTLKSRLHDGLDPFRILSTYSTTSSPLNHWPPLELLQLHLDDPGSPPRVPFNCGAWTDVEHQGFLRGLEVYGYGNCDAIGIFVPSRSPLQIEAYAQWHFAEGEAVRHLHQGIHDNLAAPYCPSLGDGGPGREPSTGCGDGGGGGNGAAAHCHGVFGELAAAREQPEPHPASQQQQRTAHRPGIPAVPNPHLGPIFFDEQGSGEHFNLHDACFGVL